MERLDIWIKGATGVVTGIVSYLVGGLGLAFTALLGLMAIDFVTGLMVAFHNKELNSNIGTRGLIKKVHVILLVGATYLIEISVLKGNGAITDGVSAAFAVSEFISIIENGGRMGIKYPAKINDLILTLKPNKKSD